MKKAISTALTPANRTVVMDMLAESPTGLEGLCQPLSPEQLHTAAAPGERSPVEVLAHLIHCEARASEAIYLALLEDQPLLPDIHPERQWGRLLRFDLLEFPDLLAYFRLRRLILLRVLASLAESQWARCIREAGKKRRESVYWRARALALHEREHLSDLRNRLTPSPRPDP